jgi:hypothetical protein
MDYIPNFHFPQFFAKPELELDPTQPDNFHEWRSPLFLKGAGRRLW